MNERDPQADLNKIQNYRRDWLRTKTPEDSLRILEEWNNFCRDKAELWLEQCIVQTKKTDTIDLNDKLMLGDIIHSRQSEATASPLREVVWDETAFVARWRVIGTKCDQSTR